MGSGSWGRYMALSDIGAVLRIESLLTEPFIFCLIQEYEFWRRNGVWDLHRPSAHFWPRPSL